MIAALFVARGGCYFGLPEADPWDEARDARLYAGPWAVVAHPPCERWGKFWYGSPLKARAGFREVKGADGGCFAAALASVRRWGGVLEHPAGSAAWRHFGLNLPEQGEGWTAADLLGGWTCEVDQAHYGHRARKATWLYAFGCNLPELPRTRAHRPDPGGKTKRGIVALMSRNQRAATPQAFRDLLLSMSRSARPSLAEVG